MKQQQLSFTAQGHTVAVSIVNRPWCEVTRVASLKEEPLTHARQVGPTCAYYALAILTGLKPATVLNAGRQVLKESRLRTFCGNHNLLIETYRRLGYKFPFDEITSFTPERAGNIPLVSFAGSGLMRLSPRARSRSGHLVAYKEGIVYDSARNEATEAEEYLIYTANRNRRWVRVIPEECIMRNGNRLTSRENEAQSYLRKIPRRRYNTWSY